MSGTWSEWDVFGAPTHSQTLSNAEKGFRIGATGVILELDHKFTVVKKLKLVGTPAKIGNSELRRSAHELEVAKFEGARLQTVSGIRGQVKKAQVGGKGLFRASFEDKILMSGTQDNSPLPLLLLHFISSRSPGSCLFIRFEDLVMFKTL